MDRVAIFVDAGYLFAQGSALLVGGSKLPRQRVKLKPDEIIEALAQVAKAKGCPSILRMYWYDGASGSPTAQQLELAHKDGVKLRLGFINTAGQQKGVDSLIVLDLIELARNRAISDAVLLSGDEDVRVGVQVAQTFGVRVHLVGIEPCRGSQSRLLMQEADSTTEFDKAVTSKFLEILPIPASTFAAVAPATPGVAQSSAPAVVPPATPGAAPSVAGAQSSPGHVSPTKPAAPQSPSPQPASAAASLVQVEAALGTIATALFAELTAPEVQTLASIFGTGNAVPREYDGKLLARSRAELNRDLSNPEKRRVRLIFIERVKKG